jgi:hypothetical protein
MKYGLIPFELPFFAIANGERLSALAAKPSYPISAECESQAWTLLPNVNNG